MEELVIDGSSCILGRTCTYAAKQALTGKKVVIVNCADLIVSGNKKNILERYKTKRARGGDAQKGPYFPRLPKDIVRRTIRGMLKYKKVQGNKAFKRIICFPDTPERYINSKKVSFKSNIQKSITLKELSRLM